MSTVGNLLRSVLPEALSDDTASRWPPDVFCLAASILKASGSYVHVLRKWPSEFSVRPVSDAGSWAEWARRVGQLWRRASAEPNAPAPDVVRSLWATVVEKDALPLAEVHGDSAFCCALLELVALADEACAGVGISDASEDDFLRRAQSLLLATPDGSASLCSEKISPAVARVLPKQHTPGAGLTLRSLTHHLARHQGNEVVPKWISVPRVSQATPTINLLLAPWPLVLRPKQFRFSSAKRRWILRSRVAVRALTRAMPTASSCGMKFSGHDSSVLAFLAQRPLALSQFERTLGQDALPVARYHAGVERDVRPELRQTGDAIRAWAEGRAQRERLSGKSK